MTYAHALLRITAISAALLLAGCAAQPSMDGGIVGSGNRPDCDAKVATDGTTASIPEECKPTSAARRSP